MSMARFPKPAKNLKTLRTARLPCLAQLPLSYHPLYRKQHPCAKGLGSLHLSLAAFLYQRKSSSMDLFRSSRLAYHSCKDLLTAGYRNLRHWKNRKHRSQLLA